MEQENDVRLQLNANILVANLLEDAAKQYRNGVRKEFSEARAVNLMKMIGKSIRESKAEAFGMIAKCDIKDRFGLSYSTIERLVRKGELCKGVKLSAKDHKYYFCADEVIKVVRQRNAYK